MQSIQNAGKRFLNYCNCCNAILIKPGRAYLYGRQFLPVYKDGYELSEVVLQKSNVFITPGGIFGNAGNKYIRVSLCATEEKIMSDKELMKAGSISTNE